MSRTPRLDPDFEREWQAWLQRPCHQSPQEVEANLGARLPQRRPVVRPLVWIGLAATLLGGCPLRQLILSGEGDTDAGVTVLGLLTGAAIAHNFAMASSPSGTGTWGPVAVVIGLVFCGVIGLAMREKV